jgi:hypothetical protein
MKNIILFSKYYLKGFVLAAAIGCLFILHSLFIDDTYSFIDFSLYLQVNSIMAVFFGLHLFVVKYIDQPQQIKNPYLRRFYTIFASYWLGVIFSFVLLCLLQTLSNFINIPYSYYFTDDNLLVGSLIGGGGIGVYFYKKYSYIS